MVADSAANLLLTANASGVAKATSAQLTGTNAVTAAQAASLGALPGLTLATGGGRDRARHTGKRHKLTAITLTDATPLAVTFTQLTGDATALALLPTTYHLTVSNVPTNGVPVLVANGHVTSFTYIGGGGGMIC